MAFKSFQGFAKDNTFVKDQETNQAFKALTIYYHELRNMSTFFMQIN